MGHPNQQHPANWPPVTTPPDSPPPTASPEASPPRRRRWPLVVAAAAVLAVLAAGGVTAYLLTRPKTAANDPTSTAVLIAACQDSAKRQLKSPGSAKFSEEYPSQVSATTWKVIGTVDAQNGFGALLRERYVCLAEKAPDRWVITGVTFTDWN